MRAPYLPVPIYLIVKRTINSLARELEESKEIKNANTALAIFILSEEKDMSPKK
jgi:hypothetical protein